MITSAEELLALNGDDFVNALYSVLFERSPSDDERNDIMYGLNLGRDRRDMLIALLRSSEVKGRLDKFSGARELLKSANAERWPVIGVFIKLRNRLSRLVRLSNRIEFRTAYIESQVSYRLVKIESEIHSLSHQLRDVGELVRADDRSNLVKNAKEALFAQMQTIDAQLVELRGLEVLNTAKLDELRTVSDGAFAEIWLKLNHIGSRTENQQ